MEVLRLAAFSAGGFGGNPAGVVLCDELPAAAAMQAVAAEVGFSETVFAAPQDGGWRVRYFAPRAEIPFCGHATIALAQHSLQSTGMGFTTFVSSRVRSPSRAAATDLLRSPRCNLLPHKAN
jgi:PhzF family phenazine biosynthesis protein